MLRGLVAIADINVEVDVRHEVWTTRTGAQCIHLGQQRSTQVPIVLCPFSLLIYTPQSY